VRKRHLLLALLPFALLTGCGSGGSRSNDDAYLKGTQAFCAAIAGAEAAKLLEGIAQGSGSSTGAVHFDEWNEPVDVNVPAHAVDIAKVRS
jgi:hypothetical protein